MLKHRHYLKGLFRPGRSLVTYTAMALIVVLLAYIATTMWTHVRLQRRLCAAANVKRIESLGNVLAKSVEQLLVSDETSILRRLISETGLEQELDVCQLVIPDEGVVAAADPSHISVVDLPVRWPEDLTLAYEENIAHGYVNMRIPVHVFGRGSAVLEISAPVTGMENDAAHTLTVQMVMAGLALGAMLLIYHQVRGRLLALGTIHETLLAVNEGQLDLGSLHLDPQLGPEAEAWNTLLDEKQRRQMHEALDQVKQNIQDTSRGSGDLAEACDALPVGMALLDANHHTQYINGAASVLLQVSPEALHTTSFVDQIDDIRVQEAISEATNKANARRRVIEIGAERGHGSGVLRFTIRPLHAEGMNLALVVVEDVTQQRVAAAARDSFLAQATHELRSPLTNIRLYVEKALEDTETSPKEVAHSLNVVNEESRRLERIVSEILSVSEIEAGSFHLDRDDVRIDTMLNQLREDHQPQAHKNKVDLVFDLSPKLPVLHADRDKVAVALHNLLGNAVKYTPEGGTVTVRADTQGGLLQVEITDTGLGIKPEDQERIFEKFYRAKDRRIASISGSGLGLAISREVIRLHGGDIAVSSEFDHGSIFTLTLPIPQEVDEDGHADSTVRSRQCR